MTDMVKQMILHNNMVVDITSKEGDNSSELRSETFTSLVEEGSGLMITQATLSHPGESEEFLEKACRGSNDFLGCYNLLSPFLSFIRATKFDSEMTLISEHLINSNTLRIISTHTYTKYNYIFEH